MHSALRPKPTVKSPPSLIPQTGQQQNIPPWRKFSTNGSEKSQRSQSMTGQDEIHSTLTSFNGSGIERLSWSLGLINVKGKYLTSETFGCQVNATGLSLKKKQKWTIIYHFQHDCIYLQSPFNYYLSTDKYGILKCDTVTINEDCRFQLEYNRSGQWAFKSLSYGMYLGGDMDQLHCFSKIQEWWSPHLAFHPQINLKHVVRKRYAKVDYDEIHIDEITPWGNAAILAVEYLNHRYCIRSSDGLYFHKDGKFIQEQTEETLFTIELYRGYLTFKDCDQSYLTAIGPLGMMTTRNKTAGKDEQFLLEESKLQICLMAPNGKLVSIRQGIDLSANQYERDDSTIFQLEYDDVLQSYHLRTCNNKYWKVEGSSIQAIADRRSIETSFQIRSTGDGHFTFQTLAGKFIIPHPTGHMRAVVDHLNSSDAYFLLKFINRSICVFKCDFGYIGHRNKNSRILECNKAQFTLFTMEEPVAGTHSEGIVYIKGADGIYWEISNDRNLSATGCEPSKFSFELAPTHSRVIIKGPNGMYLRAEQNGSISASCEHSQGATQWEF